MKRLMDEPETPTVDGLVVEDGGGAPLRAAPAAPRFRSSASAPRRAGSRRSRSSSSTSPPTAAWRSCSSSTSIPRTRASCATRWPRPRRCRSARPRTAPRSSRTTSTSSRPTPTSRIHDGRLTLASAGADGRRPHLSDRLLLPLARRRPRQPRDRRRALGHRVRTAPRACGPSRPRTASPSRRTRSRRSSASMPRNAIDAGVVDFALPIPELAARAGAPEPPPVRRARRGPRRRASDADVAQADPGGRAQRRRRRLQRVQARRPSSGGSPAGWRCAARDGSAGLPGPAAAGAGEARALYEDILIHVTSFFRDPEVFEALEVAVLPADPEGQAGGGADPRLGGRLLHRRRGLLARDRAARGPGETSARPIQIFGSDLSEPIIERRARDSTRRRAARRERRAAPALLRQGRPRLSHQQDGPRSVRVRAARPRPRSAVLEARSRQLSQRPHLLRSGAPEAGHSQPSLRAEPARLSGARPHREHLRVRPALLGRRQGNKIFARTALPSALRFARPVRPAVGWNAPSRSPTRGRRFAAGSTLAKHLDRMLLARYAPPGVLINERMEILQFRGQTGAFLEPAPGEPQTTSSRWRATGCSPRCARRSPRRRRDMAPVRRNGVEVDQDGLDADAATSWSSRSRAARRRGSRSSSCSSRSRARRARRRSRGHGRRGRRTARRASAGGRSTASQARARARGDQGVPAVAHRGARADQRRARPANEELVSGNEELQSMNEELETAKEELQSTNEELTTVNDELHSRNQEVDQVNSDLLNLLATVDIPIVILDRERRIRRFTPKARSILNVIPADVGRPIDDIKANLDVPDLDRRIAEVIDTMAMTESEVQDRDGRWYRMQIRPYKTTDNKIDGAILSLVDIDVLKHLVARVAAGERRGGAREPGQGPVPGDAGPRAPDAARQPAAAGAAAPPQQGRGCGEADAGGRGHRTRHPDADAARRRPGGRLPHRRRQAQGGAGGRGSVAWSSRRPSTGSAVRSSANRSSSTSCSTRPSAPVAGDAARLQQVVSNLLTNAIKFSSDGGHITVTLREGERVRPPQGERHRGRASSLGSCPTSSIAFPRPTPPTRACTEASASAWRSCATSSSSTAG